MENMGDILMALVSINRRYIRADRARVAAGYPEQIPLLYDSKVRYDRLEPEPGSACGDDDFADVVTILEYPSPQNPRLLADCFPIGTLLLRDDYELVPIEQIRVGDRIWGRDAWTTVEASVYKGILSVDALELNNGSVVQLTGDHHVFVGRCDRHTDRSSPRGCSCPLEDRQIERVGLRDLKQYDVLVTPERIAFGTGKLHPGRAYVEGLYVADGWSSENSRFYISGRDGKKKEAQKREVAEICAQLGIMTRWDFKSIVVNDREWAMRMHGMGVLAPEKRILSLNLDRETAEQTLRGVMADGSVNTTGGWTFSSTSKTLATQVRILHKMFGRTSSTKLMEGSSYRPGGGFGKRPIWSVGIRNPERAERLLRVRGLSTDVLETPCYDIQTSDHYVYLPEHDVTVSNCEDLACWRVAELIERFGIQAVPFIRLYADRVRDVLAGEMRPRHLYHILVRWPAGLASYPSIVYVDPHTGAYLEDPSALLGMEGRG